MRFQNCQFTSDYLMPHGGFLGSALLELCTAQFSVGLLCLYPGFNFCFYFCLPLSICCNFHFVKSGFGYDSQLRSVQR